MEHIVFDIKRLGWNTQLAEAFEDFALSGLEQGRVSFCVHGQCRVMTSLEV